MDKFTIPSPVDIRDYTTKFLDVKQLPEQVDLVPDQDEVENQFQWSSCTANAGCSALELLYSRAGQSEDFSRMFLYYFERKEGGIVGDSGAYMRDICKCLQKFGVPPEKDWEYIAANLDQEPSPLVSITAQSNRIGEYSRLDIGLTTEEKITNMKIALSKGIPVLVNFPVTQEFYNLRGKWNTHSWNMSTKILGYHAVLVVGYDDKSQRFLIENSWGKDWADGGYFGFEYKNVGLIVEMWIIKSFKYDLKPASDKDIPNFKVVSPSWLDKLKEWKEKNKMFLLVVGIIFMIVGIQLQMLS